MNFDRYLTTAMTLATALVLILSDEGRAQTQQRGRFDPLEPGEVDHREIMVPMRDGVRLATSVYIPEGEGPWPVIVSRTPYNKRAPSRRSLKYLNAGYAYVSQDCRGRFRSEGSYEPYQPDMEDGYDTIEWAARRRNRTSSSTCSSTIMLSATSKRCR